MALLGFPGYLAGPRGVEVLVFTEKPEAHRFLIEWLAFHANPQNHNLGLLSWIPDLISRHSPGLIMSGFYNTLYVQEGRRSHCRKCDLGTVPSSSAPDLRRLGGSYLYPM
jgi:hypothetical protein